MGNHKAAQFQVLSGWKEIAHYLGKGVRTVQRYESELGLPVRRPAGELSRSVIATKAEIDGWVTALPIRETFRLAQPSVDNAARLNEFSRNVQTLHRLHGEAVEMREELMRSLTLLHANIAALSEQAILSSSPEHRLLSDALSFNPAKQQKNQ